MWSTDIIPSLTILITINMLLEVQQISKSYDPAGEKKILDGLSMNLDSGASLAILGPSGSGKSTLLNILGALDKPDSGNILFNGSNLNQLSDKEHASFRNKEIGFVFQSHHLLPQCSVFENVLLPTLTMKDKECKNQCRAKAMELIQEVGLWELRDKFPATLSGGECQRVAVVRALINNPKLILADEPTGSLDRENAQSIAELLLKLNAEFNTALVVVTHSEELGRQMNSIRHLLDGRLHPAT